MKNNPFTLSFGKEPMCLISRYTNEEEIISSFNELNPPYQVCMITGVRGSGKTVSLTTISNSFRDDKNWIVIDLNPERDLLTSLAGKLSSKKELLQIFKDAKINLSFLGMGFEIDNEPPIVDVSEALNQMLARITKINKKLFIAIDEVTNNKYIREFIGEFQIFMRRNYNVFLVMTGLYENIYDLQNEKSLTFLYRAPKIELEPLSLSLIANSYKKIFELSDKEAYLMANETCGYPFAYQALGYVCFKNNKKWNEVISEYDSILESFVYEKIYSELSQKDKEIIMVIAKANDSKVDAIRKSKNIDSNIFNIYRNRLVKKGLISSKIYGHITFTLPRFREFLFKMDMFNI